MPFKKPNQTLYFMHQNNKCKKSDTDTCMYNYLHVCMYVYVSVLCVPTAWDLGTIISCTNRIQLFDSLTETYKLCSDIRKLIPERNSCHPHQKYVKAICSAHAFLQGSFRESQTHSETTSLTSQENHCGTRQKYQDDNGVLFPHTGICIWIRSHRLNMEKEQGSLQLFNGTKP